MILFDDPHLEINKAQRIDGSCSACDQPSFVVVGCWPNPKQGWETRFCKQHLLRLLAMGYVLLDGETDGRTYPRKA